MKCVILVLIAAMLLTTAQPGLGRDPFRDDPDVASPQPVAWAPEPAPVAPPPGVYLVTDTYAGDAVTRAGAVTTYSTETVHEITGSYARVLESVGTGGSSAYDGSAFNGRAALTDGRAVAGTYYENYVRSGDGFVSVGVVFFQDDSEIAREHGAAQVQPSAPPAKTAADPVRSPAPAAVASPPPPRPAVPAVERDDHAPPAPAPAPTRASTLLLDRSIEVLRGRRTVIPFSGDDVRSWRFLSGEAVALGALTGTAGDPFVARWDQLAPASGTWVVRFLVDYADGTSHERVLRVAVRAPGLVE